MSRHTSCSRIRLLDKSELLSSLIEDGIHSFQMCAAVDRERHVAAGLNSTICHATTNVCERNIALVESELLITNGKAHYW